MLRRTFPVGFILALGFFAHVGVLTAVEPSQLNKPLRVYIGTYTDGRSEGIYVAEFDASTGALSTPRLAAKSQNPSFLAIHLNGKYLYAANELGEFQGQRSGGLSAFSIDPASGELKLLNQVASGGGAPCHISLDPQAKYLLTANYTGGNIAAFSLAEDGKLKERTAFIQHEGSGVNRSRQEAPHAHAINTDPSGRFVFVNDLGVDKVFIYRPNASGGLTPADPPALEIKAGSGPRHLAILENVVYVLNELSSTVTVFSFDFATGKAKELQTLSTIPGDASGESWCAEILVHPSGRFVYASNRGHDSLAIFERGDDGKLTPKGYVKTGFKVPRNFVFDPSGAYCLVGSQTTDEVYVHRVDEKTGEMTLVGSPVKVGSPVCFRFAPQPAP